MNNHEKSEQARSFVRAWTEQNEQLIKTWLKGTKSIEAVGADLIRFMLDSSMENGALDLRGIQGPFIESLSDRADNLALQRKTDGPKPYFVQKLST